MSQLEKLLARIKNNPKSVRFDEIEKILIRNGFECRAPKGGSSHYTFYKDNGTVMLTIPKHGAYVKEIYIKQAIALLEEA